MKKSVIKPLITLSTLALISCGSDTSSNSGEIFTVTGDTDTSTFLTGNTCGNITGTISITDSNVTGTLTNDSPIATYTVTGTVFSDGTLRGNISIGNTTEGLFDGSISQFVESNGLWSDSGACTRGKWTAIRQ